jgi:hypothetical protein
MFSKVNGGLANGYIERNNIDPSVGLRFRFWNSALRCAERRLNAQLENPWVEVPGEPHRRNGATYRKSRYLPQCEALAVPEAVSWSPVRTRSAIWANEHAGFVFDKPESGDRAWNRTTKQFNITPILQGKDLGRFLPELRQDTDHLLFCRPPYPRPKIDLTCAADHYWLKVARSS